MYNIAIFASGEGTNAENIARYFAHHNDIKIKCLLSNNEKAGVHERMKPFGIPTVTLGREIWNEAHGISEYLKSEEIDLIVLSGFLAIIKEPVIKAFKHRIINIHPSLLPKYGGKGMWGINVHRAVIDAKEKESGITIHYVSEKVDDGAIICQKRCPVFPTDTPEILANRVHELEYRYFPEVIESLLIKQ
ncbi:MAG: phosphoribosylglycinamide formyltransferase [Muribaculaceae bacterium]|nr:phosphoribosylglycinamide formyltransferase [Muribaculaceae bacterium]